MADTPIKIDHELGVGRGYKITLTLTDKDTGDPVSPSRVVYAVDFDPVLTLDSDVVPTKVAIAANVVTIDVPASDTDGQKARQYAHDAVMVVSGDERDLLFGTITLVKRISKL